MKKMLIADDNKQITTILSGYAKKEGFEPVVALDGAEALDKYLQYEHEIAVVLLDVMMPEIDGFEVCRRLRKKSMVPIIMIAAVQDLNFHIKPGEIVGFIGPNGAGKSTTIKMMSGILTPTSGVISGQSSSKVIGISLERFSSSISSCVNANSFSISGVISLIFIIFHCLLIM